MDSVDGTLDLSGPSDVYFLEQTTYRHIPRRFKKQPEELPQELRFAHLNPRVAAYLQSKEKDEGEEQTAQFSTKKSLLPQINDTFNLIRHQLDSALPNDEDSQRCLFNQARTNAENVLVQLTKLLNFIRLSFQRVNVPRSLETSLLSTYPELVENVQFSMVPREWQIPSNREEYLNKIIREREKLNSEDSRDVTTPRDSMISLGGTGSRAGEDDTRSVRSARSGRSGGRKDSPERENLIKPPVIIKTPSRTKPMNSRTSNLADIAEREEGPGKSDISLKNREKERAALNSQRSQRTRLEKFRPSGFDQNRCE